MGRHRGHSVVDHQGRPVEALQGHRLHHLVEEEETNKSEIV